ncbi:MAG: hypothetical protein ACLQOO_12855 [Terriglobia bacterium]
MVSFSVKARVKPDGSLQVAIPTGLPETDVDVLVVVRPLSAGGEETPAVGSWPAGFFERTFGCLADDPLVRRPQLPQEAREKLL